MSITRLHTPTSLLPGFTVHDDFLSGAEAAALILICAELDLRRVPMRGRLLRRSMLSFGMEFGPNFTTLRQAAPIPPELESLRARCSDLARLRLRQAIVQKYPAGASVGWHMDAEVLGPVVVGVSLKAACEMRFRNEGGVEHPIELPPRSAYLMAGESRHEWLHRLRPVQQERISITFRAPVQT